MSEERFLVRNVFNPDAVKKLANEIKKVHAPFKESQFVKDILNTLETLEGFKDRMDLIAKTLETYLPNDYNEAIKIILNSLGPELTEDQLEGYDSLIILPFCEYVANKGCHKEHLEVSMNAMYALTKRSSAEFPIRIFIKRFPKETLQYIHKWTQDENQHVRRLASEGTRPRLPWAQALPAFKNDPTEVIKVLEKLKDDPELYVRRSVANNLNDIAKDNPTIVTKTLEEWNKNASKERKWIISHALRSLIKDGNKEALAIMGFSEPDVTITNVSINTPKVNLGEKLVFDFTLTSHKDQLLLVDYLIHFVKANGKLAPKTFKLTKKSFKKGESLKITKQQLFAPMTTRKLYAGTHKVQLQINGQLFEQHNFYFRN